jgi:hypothetical protein
MPQLPTTEVAPSLDDFVQEVLVQNGFGDLPEDEQQRLLPQFTEQALIRLGAAIAPRLTPKGVKEFVKLSENDTAGAEDWAGFWKAYIPDFPTIAKTTLELYVEEIKSLAHA